MKTLPTTINKQQEANDYRKHPNFHGYIVDIAFNPLRKRWEQVFIEDEVTPEDIVTLYWWNGYYKYFSKRDDICFKKIRWAK